MLELINKVNLISEVMSLHVIGKGKIASILSKTIVLNEFHNHLSCLLFMSYVKR